MSSEVQISIPKRRLYPLLLLSLTNKLEGTTRFHKLMFILKQEYEVPVEQNFIKYHYGPFSSDLRENLNTFIEYGFIEKKSDLVAKSGANGFPIINTTYKITEKGKKLIEEYFTNKAENAVFQKVFSDWGNKPLKNVIAHAKALIR